MKEISKKQLLKQINEADLEKKGASGSAFLGKEKYSRWEKESEPDERERMGLPREYPKRKIGTLESPDWFDRRLARATLDDTGKTPSPDIMTVEDPDNEGGYIVVVQIDGRAITLINEETLQEENPRFYEWATTPPNRLAFVNVKKKITTDWFGLSRNPVPDIQMKRRREVATLPFPQKYKEGEEPTEEQKIREKILRKFLNPYFRSLSDNVANHLYNAGLPKIVAPLHKSGENTDNIDKYTPVTNELIKWSTQNSQLYPSLEVYINNAKDLYRGKTPDYVPKTKHLIRQTNPGRNWSPTRPAENKDDSYKQNPLTPKYQIARQGYDPNDFDIQIVDVFTFIGTYNQDNTYTWTIEFKTQYGKKLKEESRINGGLVEDLYLDATATTGPLESLVGSDGSIASNQAIVDAFINALSDIQTKILAIDPKKELRSRFAGIGRTDATLQVNESLDIDSIVNKIIKELKQ